MPQLPRPTPMVHKPRPTLRGAIMFGAGCVALVLAAAYGRSDFLFAGLFLTIAPLAALISVTVDRPRLTVSRVFNPDAVSAGETTAVTTTVRNQSNRPTPTSTWREGASGAIEVHSAAPLPKLAEHLVGIHGGSDTARLTQRVRALVRGAHDIGPLIVSRVDPFGLAYSEYALGQSKQLLVVPKVIPLNRGELDIARADGNDHELLRHSIPSADELIAREYRSGDPLRRVHWRATARHDKLMVRQEEQRSNPEAWLLFDTIHDPQRESRRQQSHDPDPQFEVVVELVASLGVHLIDEGFDVSIVETGPRQLTGRAGAGRAGTLGGGTPTYERSNSFGALLSDLASVTQLVPAQTDSVAELAAGLRRSGRAVPVFVVLCEGHVAELGALASLRQLAEPAIAFIGEHADPRAFDVLGGAGWICVRLTARGGPREAWEQAVLEHRSAAHRG